MFKFSYKRLISIICSLLIIVSSFVSAFTLANADAEVIIQDFENHPGFSSGLVKYFTIYEATSANDNNVYDGSKSLKWTAGSGTDAVSFWQSGMDLTAGQLYKMEMQVKLTAANANSLVLKHLTSRDNGWANNGTSVTIDTSAFTVGNWYKFTTLITAEQRAIGMYIYGSADVYFDSIKFTPVTTKNVTVTVNTGTDQTVEPLKGEVGSKMTLPTLTKEGYYFAGWYTDVEFKTPFEETDVFPTDNIEIFAKWLPEGVIVQDFEKNYTYSDVGFSLYTATDENDTNVKDGTKSLKWTHTSGSKAISLYPEKELVIGKIYKLEMWIKAETSTYAHVDITQLNDAVNGWSFGENTRIVLPHFGTNYDSVGQWKKFEYTFKAEKTAMGILMYGDDDFYFDAIRWTPVNENITVDIVSNNGEAFEALKGAAGMELKLPTLTKEDYYFAGWYTDAEFTEPYVISTYPETDITLYARWITAGTFEQNFELWPGNGAFGTSPTFTLYTAEGENDPNVYSGKHSMLYSNEDKSNTFALNIFDTTMGKLQIGEKYNVSIRFKPVSTKLDKFDQNGTYHSIYNTTLQSNCWTYQSQGPQARYRAFVFYSPSFTDEYWTGTGDAVTTTTEKDENGWLTMNYEITATTPYIALYMTGYYSMFIDYITIIPLESGVVGKDYSLPYAEEFYNVFSDNGLLDAPNKTGKKVYKLDVSPRSDYVFTASLAKGLYGDPKVYLAWDEKGEQKIEGTEFVGNTPNNKLYSSRIITNFNNAIYLVVEGGGLGSSDYFAFFPTKFGCEEDPNPYYVRPVVDYNKLPSRLAADSNEIAEEITDEDIISPSTGDGITLMPILLLFITCLLVAVLTLRKRGNCNE